MTNIPENHLTCKQVQQALDVSNACLHTWRSQPDVGPPWVKIGTRYLYPVESFQAYLVALTGGAPVPRGLSHIEKLALFGRLHDPAPTNRELATRLRAVEQALLALTRIFSIEPAPEPTRTERVRAKRAARLRVKRRARTKRQSTLST